MPGDIFGLGLLFAQRILLIHQQGLFHLVGLSLVFIIFALPNLLGLMRSLDNFPKLILNPVLGNQFAFFIPSLIQDQAVYLKLRQEALQ